MSKPSKSDDDNIFTADDIGGALLGATAIGLFALAMPLGMAGVALGALTGGGTGACISAAARNNAGNGRR